MRLTPVLSTALFVLALGYGVHLGSSDVQAADVLGPGAGRPGRFPVAPRETPPIPADAHEVDWSTLLSYEHRKGLVGLPDAVKALDGRKAVMHGFLLPLYEYDDIKEFGLVANHMSCCFGMPPGVNGQVHVTLKASGRGLPNTSEPLRVIGTFRIKEVMDSGYLLSIYSLEDAEAIIVGY